VTTASALIVAAGSNKGLAGLTPLLLLIAVGAFTYLVLIRPQRSRMRQLQQTQATLAPGTEVMTTAGLYATVVDIADDTITLETSPGVHQRYARAAVARVVTPVDDDPAPDDASHDAFHEAADGEAPDDASATGR
jgi:preprotein translocase subunit YajC